MKKVFLAAALVMVSNASFAGMAESCQQYFNDLDALVAEASKTSPDAKKQLDAMKPQLDASKEALEKTPETQQDAACKQASSAMAQMKQAFGLK